MSQLISPTLGGSSKMTFRFMTFRFLLLLRVPELVDVIKCQCKAQGKQCSSETCSCHKQHLACILCCNCSGGEDCCNPHSVRPDMNSEEEGNDADDDYFQGDTVTEDMGEE